MTKQDRKAALELLTDPDLQQALQRKRSILVQRLADLQVDTMMPNWEELPEEHREQTVHALETLAEAITDIDGRLNGASDILRAFSGRGLSVVPSSSGSDPAEDGSAAVDSGDRTEG